MNVLDNLKYSKDHEWIKIDGNMATIGITDFAQRELGDIIYIDVEIVDEELEKDAVFGSIEAVKTVSDLFLPIKGKIIAFNEQLNDNPEIVNKDPYGGGWLVKVEMDEADSTDGLLSPEAYRELIGN